MSLPLIPLIIGLDAYAAYTIPADALSMSTTPAGPPAPATITRVRGDHGPNPTPTRARIEILGASLTDAYTNAYAALAAAKAAAATGTARVTWYAGAFDLLAVTAYDIEPTSAESVTLTLELLPAHPPTHYGVTLPTSPNAPRPGHWDRNFPDPVGYETTPNASPALHRPNTPALALASGTGITTSWAYYPLAAIPGTFEHAEPYDPDQIDLVAVAKIDYAPITGSFGPHLMTVDANIDPVALTAGAAFVPGIGNRLITRLINARTGAALASPLATPDVELIAGEWVAFRLRATRVTGTAYHYQGRLWNARTHPAGEPTTWQIQSSTPVDYGAAPTFAGITRSAPSRDDTAHLAHAALAYGGVPAPTINP